jgi:hypothetical protein
VLDGREEDLGGTAQREEARREARECCRAQGKCCRRPGLAPREGEGLSHAVLARREIRVRRPGAARGLPQAAREGHVEAQGRAHRERGAHAGRALEDGEEGSTYAQGTREEAMSTTVGSILVLVILVLLVLWLLRRV